MSVQQMCGTVNDRTGRVVMGGEDFPVELLVGGVVVDNDIGEGAADIDAKGVVGHSQGSKITNAPPSEKGGAKARNNAVLAPCSQHPLGLHDNSTLPA